MTGGAPVNTVLVLLAVVAFCAVLLFGSSRPHLAEPWDSILIWGVALALLAVRWLWHSKRPSEPTSCQDKDQERS
jgi:hypothetical protein